MNAPSRGSHRLLAALPQASTRWHCEATVESAPARRGGRRGGGGGWAAQPATPPQRYLTEHPDTDLRYFLLLNPSPLLSPLRPPPLPPCPQSGANVCADPAEVEAAVRRGVPGPGRAHRLRDGPPPQGAQPVQPPVWPARRLQGQDSEWGPRRRRRLTSEE